MQNRFISNDISVVIPTYNGARFIGEALESVFNQKLLPSEIIVVDDASTDNTLEVVNEYQKKSPIQIKTFRLPKNTGGPADPLNHGISIARGKFIAVLDQDDTFLPLKLEEQSEILKCDDYIACVFSFGQEIDLSNNFISANLLWTRHINAVYKSSTAHDSWLEISGEKAFVLLVKYGNSVRSFSAFMFRKFDWEQKGGLNTKLKIAADFDFLLWLSKLGKFALIPRALFQKRTHRNNVSGSNIKTRWELMRTMSSYLLLNKYNLFQKLIFLVTLRWYLHIAYQLQWNGYKYRALWCCLMISRIWGIHISIPWFLSKLPFHLFVGKLRDELNKFDPS